MTLPIDKLTWKEYLTQGDILTENQPLKLTMSSVFLSPEPILTDSQLKIGNSLSDNVLLIIDDNADIRAYERSIFEKKYQVLEAVDGKEGLELAIQSSPDMVICDLMMPRMDGFEFCQHLKSDERSSHIPVVMLTAKATLEDRIEGFEMGADEYLTKPFNKPEIQSRVRNLLRQRERLRLYFGGQPIQLQPVEAKMSVMETAFLQKARKIVEQNAADSNFGVDQLSTAIPMSQRQLVRKLKALTDYTTVEFIRHVRLELAAERLQKKQGNVSEIALELGFENLSYFAKVFQEKYGVLPSEYLAPSPPSEVKNNMSISHRSDSGLFL